MKMGAELRKEHEELCKKFSVRLRAIREKEYGPRRAWAMAEALGISSANYSVMERGKFLPSMPVLLRICKVLGCTPNELLEGMY